MIPGVKLGAETSRRHSEPEVILGGRLASESECSPSSIILVSKGGLHLIINFLMRMPMAAIDMCSSRILLFM
jgi:hypothetical protein